MAAEICECFESVGRKTGGADLDRFGLTPKSETECKLTVCRERGTANESKVEDWSIHEGVPIRGSAAAEAWRERFGAVP